MPANFYEAIVVGGGHNGLVAAGYLARAGLKVLLIERRPTIGGICGTVEYFPGYFGAISNSPGALEPKIVQDMRLEEFGLRFNRPDPTLVTPFPDGRAFVAWREREKSHAELKRFSEHDADAYYAFFEYLDWFARRLKISVFEPPPSIRELTARLNSPEEEEAFGRIFFGSIKTMLDERFETEEVKSLIAALAVVSHMVGPSTPGTPYMLLQRPLSLASMHSDSAHDPRRQPMRGSTGLPIGGMGAITDSMHRSLVADGVHVRLGTAVESILVRNGAVEGVAVAGGDEFHAPMVLSNVNPKTTYLSMLDRAALDGTLRGRIERIPMAGSAFKIALALDAPPRLRAARTEEEARLFSACQFRISPSMEYFERAYDDAKYGRPSAEPALWGLTPSVSDPSVTPPGKHVMSINVFHAPYHLREGTWTELKDTFGRRCIDILSRYFSNIPDAVEDIRFWSPEDLEAEYGLVEANTTHGDVVPSQMFSLRPIPGLSDYRGPVRGLYLCGAGAFPGGFVNGLPGHNASHVAIADYQAIRDEGRLKRVL